MSELRVIPIRFRENAIELFKRMKKYGDFNTMASFVNHCIDTYEFKTSYIKELEKKLSISEKRLSKIYRTIKNKQEADYNFSMINIENDEHQKV